MDHFQLAVIVIALGLCALIAGKAILGFALPILGSEQVRKDNDELAAQNEQIEQLRLQIKSICAEVAKERYPETMRPVFLLLQIGVNCLYKTQTEQRVNARASLTRRANGAIQLASKYPRTDKIASTRDYYALCLEGLRQQMRDLLKDIAEERFPQYQRNVFRQLVAAISYMPLSRNRPSDSVVEWSLQRTAQTLREARITFLEDSPGRGI